MEEIMNRDAAHTEIPGLTYVPEFIEPDEAAALAAVIDDRPWDTSLRRRVQHYGYRYDYKARAVTADSHLGPLPGWLLSIAKRLGDEGLMPVVPDQAIINEYEPGQGIAAHVDCQPCFGDTIVSVSLGSACVMRLTSLGTKENRDVVLEPGSALVLSGESRHAWSHGIAARKSDVIYGVRVPRSRRVSVTFRSVVVQ